MAFGKIPEAILLYSELFTVNTTGGHLKNIARNRL